MIYHDVDQMPFMLKLFQLSFEYKFKYTPTTLNTPFYCLLLLNQTIML